jgi:hypothetical protein
MFKALKTGILAVILINIASIANAQKKILEGIVTYTRSFSQDVEAEEKIYFNGNISRSEIKIGPMKITFFNDSKNITGLMLVDNNPVFLSKKAAKISKEDIITEKKAEGNGKITDLNATNDKQVIAGFNSKKYTFKSEAGENFEVWLTNEIDLPINMLTVGFKNVKGTIVKFTGKMGTVTLKSISEDKVGEMSVTKIPNGYEEVTYAELNEELQGGGEE